MQKFKCPAGKKRNDFLINSQLSSRLFELNVHPSFKYILFNSNLYSVGKFTSGGIN